MGYSDLYHSHYTASHRDAGQSGSALTGTVAAGLAANGVVWTLRYPDTSVMPSASVLARRLYVQRIHVQYVTGTAYTTPVTLGRHLKLVRATAAAGTADPSGGAAYTMVRKRSDGAETLCVGRVATTGALTTTGFTLGEPVQRMVLSQAGASGAAYDEAWRFDGIEADPLILLPGQALFIAAGALFDAVGTFELNVDVDAVEVP
jgi:hypothetical protein